MSRKNNVHFCVPTIEELNGIKKHLGSVSEELNWHVTGLGVMTTAYHLAKINLTFAPDEIIHLGIAGSYEKSLDLGTVVEVRTEKLVDFGAEGKTGQHLSFHELVPSVNGNHEPWNEKQLINPTSPYPPTLALCYGITVPFAAGEKNTIARRAQYHAQIESMEGAAVFYTCIQENIPFHCLRAISNYVEERDRDNWQVGMALKNLAKLIDELMS